MHVKTIVGILTVIFLAVGYVVQNWIMSMIPSDWSPTAWQAAGVFAAIAGIGALIPFMLYVVAVLWLIRRQER